VHRPIDVVDVTPGAATELDDETGVVVDGVAVVAVVDGGADFAPPPPEHPASSTATIAAAPKPSV
jgi:hypothetical protein